MTLAFGLPGNPVSAMVTFQLFARPALAALQGAPPDAASRDAPCSLDAVPRNPRREQAVRVTLRPPSDGLVAEPTGAQGSHMLTSMLGADGLALIPHGEGEAGGRRARGGRAAVRPRDPRRLLERQRRAGARVVILHVPSSPATRRTAPSEAKQVAEVTLPRAELERIWSPEYLERLARTYWSFLSRFSLGLIRVLYTRTRARSCSSRAPSCCFASASRSTTSTPTAARSPGRSIAACWWHRRGRGRGFLRLSVRAPSRWRTTPTR